MMANAHPGRGSVWSAPGMVALGVLTLTGFSGYAALLPVAPLWVREGGADTAGAGLVNFVLLAATVLTQVAVPRAVHRLGWSTVLVTGMVLLGVPPLLHLLSSDLGPTLVLSAVRGVGFGILTVTGGVIAALLVEASRRGAAIGAYSLSLSVPNVVLMPLAAWVALGWGFGPVFLLSALPLLGIPACLSVARHLPVRSTSEPGAHDAAGAAGTAGATLGADGLRATLRPVLLPSLILLAITFCGGALITFAPQLVAVPWLSAAALFALGLTSALARWRVGALADRRGPARLTWPFVLVGAVGMVLLAWSVREPVQAGGAWSFVLAATLLGAALGALQNLTMLQAFAAAGPRRLGPASAIWNVGFDTGTACGALVVGAVAVAAGMPLGMLLGAGLCLATLPLALRLLRPAD